jgi:hypothetical protein
MGEKRIAIFDAETPRLLASARVLEQLFPDASVDAASFFDISSIREKGLRRIMELLEWTKGEERAALVVSNADGIDLGIVKASMDAHRERIHCIVTTCYDRTETEEALQDNGLALSERIGHVQCASMNMAEHERKSGKHRERFVTYLSSLPADHPFAIGSKSTTYSTLDSDTYAASNR